MLIHRRVAVVKEGQTEKLVQLLTSWFEKFNPWSVTRIYIPHSGTKDHSSTNSNLVVWEHESEDLDAFEAGDAQWHTVMIPHLTEEDMKAWSELVEKVTVEFWTVSSSHKKQD